MKCAFLVIVLVASLIVVHAQDCATDLETAGSDLGLTAAAIARAVSECRSTPTNCATAVEEVVGYLGNVTVDVSRAAADCGNVNAECESDIGAMVTAVAALSEKITKAVSDCHTVGLMCVLDVVGAGIDAGKVTSDIFHAVSACKPARVATVSANLRQSSFARDPLTYTFATFVREFGKHYSSVEYGRREDLFLQNMRKINEINARYASGESTWHAAPNKFADMTPAEFKRYRGLKKQTQHPSAIPFAEHATHLQSQSAVDALPTSVDWRTKGGKCVG